MYRIILVELTDLACKTMPEEDFAELGGLIRHVKVKNCDDEELCIKKAMHAVCMTDEVPLAWLQGRVERVVEED